MTKADKITKLTERAADLLARIGALASDAETDATEAMGNALAGRVIPLACELLSAKVQQGARLQRSQAGSGVTRARGRKRSSDEVETALRKRFTEGMGILRAAAEVGCGTSVAQRVKREMLAETSAPG